MKVIWSQSKAGVYELCKQCGVHNDSAGHRVKEQKCVFAYPVCSCIVVRL